jgi:hypothetical protein
MLYPKLVGPQDILVAVARPTVHHNVPCIEVAAPRNKTGQVSARLIHGCRVVLPLPEVDEQRLLAVQVLGADNVVYLTIFEPSERDNKTRATPRHSSAQRRSRALVGFVFNATRNCDHERSPIQPVDYCRQSSLSTCRCNN